MPASRATRGSGRGSGRPGSARHPGPAAPTPGSGADDAPDADPESVARGIVLRKLTAAPRTRAQLADDLAARAVPEDVAERVLDRFTEVGLVDDSAFAEAWVRSRHTGRGLSRRALAQELRRKGVDDETVTAAVEEIDPDDERAAAAALVARRLPATRGLARETRVRRLVAMLGRKGYSGGLAMAVVRAALGDEDRQSGAPELTDEGVPDGDPTGDHA